MLYKNSSNLNEFYSPFLKLSEKTEDFLFKEKIIPEVREFFLERGVYKFTEFNRNLYYSDMFIKKVDTYNFLYGDLFSDIKKRKDNLDILAKYCIVINKSYVKHYCKKTGLHFGTLKMYKTNVLYYIYYDINDISEFMENEARK